MDWIVPKLERMTDEIARCRLMLSRVAIGLVLVHATEDTGRGTAIAAATIFAAHFAFASGMFLLVKHGRMHAGLVTVVPWVDAGFAVALAAATAGDHSPFFAFAAFAVVATALNGQPREALGVTTTCAAFYVAQATWGIGLGPDVSVMRAACLVILGYLVVRLAQKRSRIDAALRIHESAMQRQRLAREIHDGCAGLLAAIDVRLETDRELIRSARYGEALADLGFLRERVRSEQGELRAFSRRLAEVEPSSAAVAPGPETTATRYTLDVGCEGSADLLESVLAILRESIRNVEHHAHAASATLRVRVEGSDIVVDVVDDGIGFAPGAPAPWSIASRLAELGGLLKLGGDGPGAHLSISLPRL